MKDARTKLAAAIGIVLLVGLSAYAIRWSPNELDVAQEPGTTATYLLQLQNESDDPVQVDVFVADWTRGKDGANDLSIPLNGARWVFERSFSAGDVVVLRYSVRIPEGERLDVTGEYRSWAPQVEGAVTGANELPGDGESGEPPSSGMVSIHRKVESADADGQVAVSLTIRTSIDFTGLTIEEVFSEGVEVTSLDAGEAQFDTINRSCADWVRVSQDRVALEANESREIELQITTPDDYDGTYWCIVHAQSQALQVIGEIAGTQIVSRPSVGLKTLVTSPGTEVSRGEVIDVQVVETDPLVLEARFRNTGNIQLVVTAAAEVIDSVGSTVASLSFSEYGRDYFRILPGSTRTIQMTGFDVGESLPSGIYQAIVSFDFGGDALVVGVKGFRIQ